MDKGCVRFKKLDDLWLSTHEARLVEVERVEGRWLSHAKREVGAACALLLVQRRIPPLCGNPHPGNIMDALAGA
jgi:hypothetical protein